MQARKKEPLLRGHDEPEPPYSSSHAKVIDASTSNNKEDDWAPTEPYKSTTETESIHFTHAVRFVLLVHSLSSIFGLDIGITSGVILWLEDKGDDDDEGGVFSVVASSSMLRGFIVSALSLGCVVGCFLSIKWGHTLGSRQEVRLGAITCCLGSFVEALTSLGDWKNSATMISIFCCGRVVSGIGVGVMMLCIPVYVGELAPPAYRGMLSSLEEVAIVLGLTVGYVIGIILRHPVGGYFIMALICGVSGLKMASLPPSISSILSGRERAGWYFPWSWEKHWYTRTGKDEDRDWQRLAEDGDGQGRRGGERRQEREGEGGDGEVLAALRFLNPLAASTEVQLFMEEHLSFPLNSSSTSSTSASPAVYGLSDATVSVSDCSTSTSISSSTSTAPSPSTSSPGISKMQSTSPDEERKAPPPLAVDILRPTHTSLLPSAFLTDLSLRLALRISIGMVLLQVLTGMPALMYYATVLFDDINILPVWIGLTVIGIIKLSCAVFVTITVDWFGRKTLLVYGMSGMLVGLALFAVAAFFGLSDTDASKVAALTGFYIAVATYEVGVGPITWVLIGELFPSSYKKEASALCIMVNFGTSAILTLVLPAAKESLGWGLLFTEFALVTLGGLIFIRRYVVETSQLSLQEVQEALEKAAKAADKQERQQLTSSPATSSAFSNATTTVATERMPMRVRTMV